MIVGKCGVLKMELKKGDIFLYKNGTSLYSKIIKHFTKSKYSHVGLLLDADPNKLTTGEALSRGFVIQDSMGWIDKQIKLGNVDVYRYPSLGKNQAQSIVDFTYSIKDAGYDWLDIFDIAVFTITRDKIQTGSINKYFCSEAVAKAYTLINADLCPRKLDDEVTPRDIHKSKLLKKVIFDAN